MSEEDFIQAYILDILFRYESKQCPLDPVPIDVKYQRFYFDLPEDTYNLISALARDSGKDFLTIFAESLKFMAGFLTKFDEKHYKETRRYL